MDVADDIVVTGRNVHVPEGYREHVRDKLTRVRRYDDSVVRYEVELLHEPNPKQSKTCQRVEITGRGAGMLVRAEACGPDFYTALDCATAKLATRLRRAHDRRRVHHGLRQPTSVAEATANTALPANTPSNRSDESDPDSATPAPDPFTPPTDNHTTSTDDQYDHDHGRRWESTDPGGPGRIVREKHHSAEPITVDQALYEMELVGHDFYLFVDAADSRASVVYRRKGLTTASSDSPERGTTLMPCPIARAVLTAVVQVRTVPVMPCWCTQQGTIRTSSSARRPSPDGEQPTGSMPAALSRTVTATGMYWKPEIDVMDQPGQTPVTLLIKPGEGLQAAGHDMTCRPCR